MAGTETDVETELLTVGHGTLRPTSSPTCSGMRGVRTLVDVRRYRQSRRHPQFGRDDVGVDRPFPL